MNWFRSNIRLGSRVAIFALAIQFLASFGHFHDSNLQATPGADHTRSGVHEPYSFIVAKPEASIGASSANASGPVRLKTPSGHVPPGQGTDECGICAVMAFANAITLASPPELPATQATAFRYLVSDVGLGISNSARLPFQPRAPPIA
jgi:hypothetical protein